MSVQSLSATDIVKFLCDMENNRADETTIFSSHLLYNMLLYTLSELLPLNVTTLKYHGQPWTPFPIQACHRFISEKCKERGTNYQSVYILGSKPCVTT